MSSTILNEFGTIVPNGTSAQRPSGNTSGTVRYNNTIQALEYFGSLNWETVSAEKISNLTTYGGNAFALLKGGKLFTTHGSTGAFNFNLSGRGGDANDPYYGVDTGLKEVPIPSLSPIKQMFKGHEGGMGVLLEDGSLYMWGTNANGQCGFGDVTSKLYPTLSATGVVKVWGTIGGNDYGGAYSCTWIQKSDGLVYSCGYNATGQCGLGNITTPQKSWIQVTNFAANTVVDVFPLGSAGALTFVTKTDGTIWVIGYNGYGQTGIGSILTTPQTTWQNVTTNWGGNLNGGKIYKMCYMGYYTDGTTATQGYTVMMHRTDSTNINNTAVYTCGNGNSGELGNGGTADISSPYLIPNSSSVADVAMLGSYYKTCQMLKNDGSLWAWGYNGYGAVGDGTIVAKSSPVNVANTVIKLFSNQMGTHGTAGNRVQSFIKKSDNHIYACGYDDATGYLGTGNTGITLTHTITWFPYDVNVIEIGSFCTTNAGRTFVALTDKNSLYCWGYNGYNGTCAFNTTSTQIPTQVTAIPSAS